MIFKTVFDVDFDKDFFLKEERIILNSLGFEFTQSLERGKENLHSDQELGSQLIDTIEEARELSSLIPPRSFPQMQTLKAYLVNLSPYDLPIRINHIISHKDIIKIALSRSDIKKVNQTEIIFNKDNHTQTSFSHETATIEQGL